MEVANLEEQLQAAGTKKVNGDSVAQKNIAAESAAKQELQEKVIEQIAQRQVCLPDKMLPSRVSFQLDRHLLSSQFQTHSHLFAPIALRQGLSFCKNILRS